MRCAWIFVAAFIAVAFLLDGVASGGRRGRRGGRRGHRGHEGPPKGHGGHGDNEKATDPTMCQDGNKAYQNGEQWIDSRCIKLNTCRNGRTVKRNYRCPRQSVCQNGQCMCKPDYEPMMNNGLLLKCNKIMRSCTDNEGTEHKHDEEWLSQDCMTRFRCLNGNARPARYRCISTSMCKHGHCECKPGFRLGRKNNKGLLAKCDKILDCEEEGKTFVNGASWLNSDCSEKKFCSRKKVRSIKFKCPKHSSCHLGGQCVCDYGYELQRKQKNGMLTSCKATIRCPGGFEMLAGECSYIRTTRLNFLQVRQHCNARGSRLLVSKDILHLVAKFKQRGYRKNQRFFILGIPELLSENIDGYKNSAIKLFVLTLMARFKISEPLRYRTLRRLSGQATRADWNFKSSLKSYCVAVSIEGPEIVKCSERLGYICQSGIQSGENGMYWSSWFQTDPGLRERGMVDVSHAVILKTLNTQYRNSKDRLCKKPLAIQCREARTNIVYTKTETHGYGLRMACSYKHLRISCLDRVQRNKECPNLEMRFQCVTDRIDCDTDMMKKYCKAKGMICVDHRTGPMCVRQKPFIPGKVGLGHCRLESKYHRLHRCKAAGDPHYRTLDGKTFDFMGTCTYDFLSICNGYVPTDNFPSFRISVKNYKRKPGRSPSWTKNMEFVLGDNVYLFTQGKFYVNEILINPVGFSNDDITIQAQAKGRYLSLLIETKFCLKIIWDNRHGIFVWVPEVYMDYTCGLCGNFDGRRTNDLIKPGTKRRFTASEIGREFLVKGSDDTQCPIKVDQPKPCSKALIAKYSKPSYCGVLKGVIAQWVRKKSAGSSWKKNYESLKEEFDECVNDLCWDATTKRCDDLEDVVEELGEELGSIDFATDQKWRKQARCESKCGLNMIYSKKMRPFCQDSCANPDKAQNCGNEKEKPGCVCKKGFVLDAKLNCVPKDKCEVSCTVEQENGNSFSLSNGDEFVALPCELTKVCKNGKLIEKRMKPCSIHADCVGGGKTCRCREGFIGDGTECKNDMSCRKGWTAVGEKCYKYVPKSQDWHTAAIKCGALGGSLARYDDDVGEELVTYIKDVLSKIGQYRAFTRNILCKAGAKCQLPRRCIGVSIKLRSKKDERQCNGLYAFAADKRSIIVKGNCKAFFAVQIMKDIVLTRRESFKIWIGGNSLVIKQGKRGDKTPFQVDPPKMLDLTVFTDPNGCFQSSLNRKGKLIVTPNPDCNLRKPSICEYDNTGKKTFNPTDFIRLKELTNYRQAVQKCKNLNRPLVQINNDVQLKKVRVLLRNLNANGWIGAEYSKGKNKFVWSNNKPLSYNKWKISEPNNYNKNAASNERCVAMDKRNGQWSTEDCSQKNYPVCGLPFDMEVATYSKYYDVKGFSSLTELIERLRRQGKTDYLCKDPISVECSAKEELSRVWRNNFNQQGNALICNKNRLVCRKKQGLDCSTFRVRFMCPPVEDQCAALKKLNVQPCSGGRICSPVKNHYLCQCPKGMGFSKGTQSCIGYCGACKASGDPHYTNFAGRKFDFMGVCMYKFAGTCDLPEFKDRPTFDVYTKNKRCGGRGASCIFYVEVHLRKIPYMKNGNLVIGDFSFAVQRGTTQYTLNDRTMELGVFEIPGAVKIVRKKNYFFLMSGALSLKVLFSGTHLGVAAPSTFRHKMCGLCGDCGSSDFRMKDNSLVKIPNYGRKAIIPYANEWIVPYDGSDPAACKTVEPFEECKAEMKNKLSKPNMCGIFKNKRSRISECFKAIDPKSFYDDCMVDACHDKAMESVCRSVKIYAQACMEKDIVLSWRTEDFCPLDCKEKVYRADASCEPMCGRDNSNGACEEEPEEGCVCPDGFMKQGEDCVRPDKCGCEVVTDNGETLFLPPGKSVLLPRCEERAVCQVQEDGSMETIRETVALDPNAVCVEDPQPRITCADGYVMQPDGKTCKREAKGCADGFVDRQGMCLKIPSVLKVWRQAAQACNEKDGTLVQLDTDLKLTQIAKIMKRKNYDQVFIGGLVKVKRDKGGNIKFKPVVAKEDIGKPEFVNYVYHEPSLTAIRLSENLPQDIKQGTILALAVQREEGSKAFIVAVSRSLKTNFICEERKNKPEEEVWYGPCNSDKMMDDDGDQETRESLRKTAQCLVCPYPKDVKCTKVKGATGTVEGTCGLTKSGKIYSCDQGGDCIDKEISTKCVKDVDECKKDLDDCPPSSTCVNTIGGYYCKCDDDVPLMINGFCKAKVTCEMNGPKSVDDFEYKLKGLANVPGYFGYKCPFKIFSVCLEKYLPGSNLPIMKIYKFPVRKDGKLISAVGGSIQDPIIQKERFFMLDKSMLKKGKFQFGTSFEKSKLRDLGFSSVITKTSFNFIPPDIFVMQHFDKHFKIMITYPFIVKIEVSSEYAQLACGACTMKPAAPLQVIKVTPSQERELSEENAGNCNVDLVKETITTTTTTTTPPTTTTTTTTTPKPTTTTTTTTPPPTTTPTTTTPKPTTTTTTPKPTTTTTTTPAPTTTTTTTTTPPPTTTTTTTTPKPTTTTTTTPAPTTTTTTTTTPPPTTTTTTTTPKPTTTTTTTTTPAPTTTTTTTTAAPPPSPTTTTSPPPTTPPTTPAVCTGEADDFCTALNDMCENFNKAKCMDKICEMNLEFCNYLKTEDLKCQDGSKMANFLKELNCDKVCPKDMIFQHTNGVPLERCQEVEDSCPENPEIARSFGCTCDNGYKLSGAECIPSEECGCTDMLEGVYMKPGAVEIIDGCTVKKTCLGRDKFKEEKMQCGDNAVCKYKETGYQCTCKKGYFGDAEKKDGCKKGVEDERKVCYNFTNTNGIKMERCQCKDGYVSDCSDCIDLDECKENRHDCDLSVEKCVNIPGSYKCSCADGFDVKNGKCVDIDECKSRIARCGPHEGCVNLIGSYDCKCCAGFKFNRIVMECERDERGIEILVSQPKCCLNCDDKKLCLESEFNPVPFCVKNAQGGSKEFKSYKALYQYHCVNNLNLAKSDITKGKCPQTVKPGGNGPGSGGQGGNGGSTGGPNGPQTTNPSGGGPTRGPSSCNDPKFCSLIPQPPQKLAKGKVCGPPNQKNKKTYKSYCAMVKAVCKKLGGPGYLPKVPIQATSGKCKNTPGIQVLPPIVTLKPSTGSSGPAPTVEPSRPGPSTPLPPVEPLFLEWSPWTTCRVTNAAAQCGIGRQRRRRETTDYDDGRAVLPVKKRDLYEERTCFKPCVPIDPNLKCPKTDVCEGDDSPVCGVIGRGSPETYNSECELNVLACQDGKKPVFVSDGDCNGDNGSQKKLCNEAGPQEVLKKYKKVINSYQCVGEEKMVKVCKGLVCEGGSGNCCIPTGYEKIKSGIVCYDDKGDLKMKGSVVYISVTGCRCSKGEGDEAGTEGNSSEKP